MLEVTDTLTLANYVSSFVQSTLVLATATVARSQGNSSVDLAAHQVRNHTVHSTLLHADS
jgi:hypothetical protein